MRILLTGATGYIGSAVLDVLVEAGHEVTAVVRTERAARDVAGRGATAVQGDVTAVDWFAAKLAKTGPPASFTVCAAVSSSAHVVGGVMPYWSKMSVR